MCIEYLRTVPIIKVWFDWRSFLWYDSSTRTKRNPKRMSSLYDLFMCVSFFGIFIIAFWFIGMIAIYSAISHAARDVLKSKEWKKFIREIRSEEKKKVSDADSLSFTD